MGIFKETIKFTTTDPGSPPAKWRVTVESHIKDDALQYTVRKDGTLLYEETRVLKGADIMLPQTLHITDGERALSLEIGSISLLKLGAVLREGESLLHRTHDKPFRGAGKMGDFIEKMESIEAHEPTPEEQAKIERSKALYPSIAVDIAMGIIFFFVAKEYGLLTAALAGSAATIVLTIIDRFVKPDLLGGFAVFGVVMALISASLAYFFQDDLFIKLRGSIMGCIGASFALFDALVLKGGYLGKRMARYMEGLFKLEPQRAAFAMAGFTLAIIVIDTPLAFILTTDQWIYYNAFLDSLISMPLFFLAMFLAREKKR